MTDGSELKTKRRGMRLITVSSGQRAPTIVTASALASELKAFGLDALYCPLSAEEEAENPLEKLPVEELSGAIGSLFPERGEGHWDIFAGPADGMEEQSLPLTGALLCGTFPDVLVLCHRPDEQGNLSESISEAMDLYTGIVRPGNPGVQFAGIACDTGRMDSGQSEAFLAELQDVYKLPCVDPARHGVRRIADMIYREWGWRSRL